MIFTGFQPNAIGPDVRLASTYLLFPWKWARLIKGEYENKACRILRKHFSVYHAYLFDSGRSALEIALRSLEIHEGDEVIVQAYTCIVVTNAIRWTGATPIFVDITKNFTLNPDDLEKKITPQTRAIIVQHTFGIPADMEKIMKIAKDRNIKVIEDCAHVIGGEYQGKKLGTIGDIGMFSFGSDKVISCGRGGALITANDALGEKIQKEYETLAYPKRRWIIPYLWNFPTFVIGKALYRIGIGKIFLAILKKLSISGRVIYEKEKKGNRSHFKVSRLANSLAHILYGQLQELEEMNEHRKQIAKWYEEEIATKEVQKPEELKHSFYVRYPILVEEPQKLHAHFKKEGILLGDWYDTVIAPDDIVMEKTGYTQGTCPTAEKLTKQSINLPTSRHITITQADKIARLINSYYDRD